MLPSSATKRHTNPDTHLHQKIHTDTHVPKHNGLVQTVLLQDFHHNKTQLKHMSTQIKGFSF